MQDKTLPRTYAWLWYFRIFQQVLTLIILGLAAANASAFGSIQCGVPGKLGYNIACAVISFLVLLYFLRSSGPKVSLRVFPWSKWVQAGLDGFLFILWLAAACSSQLSCDDICNACSGTDYDMVYIEDQWCSCEYVLERDFTPYPRELRGPIHQRASHGGIRSHRATGTRSAKISLDAIATVLFAISLGASIYWIIQNSNTGSTADHPMQATPATQEAGMYQGTPDNAAAQPPPQGMFSNLETQKTPQHTQSEGYPQQFKGQFMQQPSFSLPEQQSQQQPQSYLPAQTHPEAQSYPEVQGEHNSQQGQQYPTSKLRG